jgi:hypothetical protein
MIRLPDPAWPVVVLAVICAIDAILCLGPVSFVRNCLQDVRFPRRYWPVLPVVKLAAAAGLVAGLWIPGLALLTSAALVAYFAVAIGMHLRARDLGRNLFVNASGMLVICVAVPAFCLLP